MIAFMNSNWMPLWLHTAQQLVNLSMLSWGFFYQWPSQHSFQPTGCFPQKHHQTSHQWWQRNKYCCNDLSPLLEKKIGWTGIKQVTPPFSHLVLYTTNVTNGVGKNKLYAPCIFKLVYVINRLMNILLFPISLLQEHRMRAPTLGCRVLDRE